MYINYVPYKDENSSFFTTSRRRVFTAPVY